MSQKNSPASDLLVCIRCHKFPDFVRDTAEAVKKYTDPWITKLMFAVDHNPRLATNLSQEYPGQVYCSRESWGWGAGLYGLLAESVKWAESQFRYSHFLSIDYDTLFIGPGVDDLLLNHIDSPKVGLVGEYNARNVHWATIFTRDSSKIKGHCGAIPRSYREGEGLQGGFMTLTRSFIDELKKRKMLEPPFSHAKSFTSVADDHLVTLFCRMCELEIVQVGPWAHVRWQLGTEPTGLEKKGVKVFHPTKIRPDNRDRKAELQVRNYYRKLRGQGALI